ncbi:unnamed protein product [Urochloa humidicola]
MDRKQRPLINMPAATLSYPRHRSISPSFHRPSEAAHFDDGGAQQRLAGPPEARDREEATAHMALQGIKMTVSATAGESSTITAPPVPADVLGGGGGGDILIDPPPSSEHQREVEDDADLTHEDLSNEDDSDGEYVDSDSEFEDDDDDQPPDVVAHGATAAAVRLAGFLGRPTRFATVHGTAAFMRLSTAEAAPDHGGGGEILVHYRYTRFLRGVEGGGGGVEAHVLDPAASSLQLQLAGAAVAPLLYPARFGAELRALWSGLVAMAPVPPAPPLARTTRLVVAVDAGILRPGDFSPARMRSMVAALESMACEVDARPAAVSGAGAELLLPAPVAAEDDVRPAKRRRVAGEDCPICCEALEQGGLAAWPRCSHIFHARCLEEHLVRGAQECPMCRSGLAVDAQRASTE